jgi:hypothetical protein
MLLLATSHYLAPVRLMEDGRLGLHVCTMPVLFWVTIVEEASLIPGDCRPRKSGVEGLCCNEAIPPVCSHCLLCMPLATVGVLVLDSFGRFFAVRAGILSHHCESSCVRPLAQTLLQYLASPSIIQGRQISDS